MCPRTNKRQRSALLSSYLGSVCTVGLFWAQEAAGVACVRLAASFFSYSSVADFSDCACFDVGSSPPPPSMGIIFSCLLRKKKKNKSLGRFVPLSTCTPERLDPPKSMCSIFSRLSFIIFLITDYPYGVGQNRSPDNAPREPPDNVGNISAEMSPPESPPPPGIIGSEGSISNYSGGSEPPLHTWTGPLALGVRACSAWRNWPRRPTASLMPSY